jgi:hypothetical protein
MLHTRQHLPRSPVPAPRAIPDDGTSVDEPLTHQTDRLGFWYRAKSCRYRITCEASMMTPATPPTTPPSGQRDAPCRPARTGSRKTSPPTKAADVHPRTVATFRRFPEERAIGDMAPAQSDEGNRCFRAGHGGFCLN